jgi:hypothetical protein
VLVGVRVFVDVRVLVGVRVFVDVRVLVGVRVSVRVAVTVAVRVAVRVFVDVRVLVGVRVFVDVRVPVGVRVLVHVALGVSTKVAVSVGVEVGAPPAPHSMRSESDVASVALPVSMLPSGLPVASYGTRRIECVEPEFGQLRMICTRVPLKVLGVAPKPVDTSPWLTTPSFPLGDEGKRALRPVLSGQTISLAADCGV